MQAIVQDKYGSPDVLELRDVAVPTPGAGEVLVRVHAAGVNPADWHFMRGEPYVMRLQAGLRRPSNPVRGIDIAGTVERVGPDVTKFEPGDAVYGVGSGTFAGYARCSVDRIAPKPASLTFETAAAVPLAAITALQGLRTAGELRAGQTVLVNGASGGIGTFAVQLASLDGAVVTGVCSGRNVELVRSLGATHVIDYTATDFTESDQQYDVVFDLVGNRSLSALRRVLTPDGTLVLCGGAGGRWLGPLGKIATALAISPFVSQEFRAFLADETAVDLATLTPRLERGELTVVVDETYPLEATPEAIRHVETGHARGKVVVVP